jgi:hypothetical protein
MLGVQQVRWSRGEVTTRKLINKGGDQFDGH